MCRLTQLLMSTVATALLVVGLAYALPERRSPGDDVIREKAPTRRGPFLSGVLGNGNVQEELGLSGEQKQKIEKMGQESVLEFKEAAQTGWHSEAYRKKMREMHAKVTEEEDKRLRDILKPEQLHRLKQLELQRQGVHLLRNPEVVRELGLSLEQQEKLNSLLDEQLAEMMNQTGPPRLSRQQLMEQALKLLTPEQRQKVEKILGKPFDWSAR
jgi:Spy/CpxP family protein refolding chaperone